MALRIYKINTCPFMRGGGAFLCSLDKEALNFVFSLLSHATHKGCNYFKKIPNVKFQNSVASSVLRYTLESTTVPTKVLLE